MKFFLITAVIAVLAVQANAAGLNCTVSQDAYGAESVTISLSPSVSSLLKNRPDLKSPGAIVSLLSNSTFNPVIAVAKTLTNFIVKSVFPFPGVKIPSCEFFWISNELICTNVPSSVLTGLCTAFGSISKITAPGNTTLPFLPSVAKQACDTDGLWGLPKIGAGAVNTAGFKGQGVVVAGIDSGVRQSHNELKNNWRSQYGWYNAYNPTDTQIHDDNGHGTHTMGSIAGATVGVAPSATWIACKACDAQGSCGNAQLLRCLQWCACPSGDTSNAQQCTATAPKVINNSWGGGIGDTKYNEALATLARMGIINVFAAGNSGNQFSCATVASPADEVRVRQPPLSILSIGATDCADKIASFSSSGPTQAAANMGELGITVAGPGVNILSAWFSNDNATNTLSGTSMSAPYVTGSVAVLLSKNPALTFDQIEAALTQAAAKNSDATLAQNCYGANMSQTALYPNNRFGYGRIQLDDSATLV